MRQVALVEREVFELTKKTTRIEHAYLVTSLSAQQANAEQVLQLNRAHWGIENRLHYVRDMAFDEDRCRARKGSTPQVLACLRNFAISLLRLNGYNNITATLRALAAQPSKILRLLEL